MDAERIERTRRGEVRLRLPREERRILKALLAELADRLVGEPEAEELRRLFPPAYGEDVDREAEYRGLVRGGLLEGRLDDLRLVEATLDGPTLAEDELEAWLRTLNDLRLLLGTRLDVTEEFYGRELDPSDPAAPALALYTYLSWLQEQAVEAAAS